MVARTRVARQASAPHETIPRCAAPRVSAFALELQSVGQARRSHPHVEIGRHEYVVRVRAECRNRAPDERSYLQADRNVLNRSQRVESARAHESNAAQTDERIDAR